MKYSFIIPVLFVFALMNCTKTIAIEEELIDKSYHIQTVGSSARDILSKDNYNSLKIEVQYMQGFEPDDQSLQNLKTFLYKYINKPGGITITKKEIPAYRDTILSMNAIRAIEKANRMEYNIGKELSIYILYTNGFFSDDKMLGYAYQNTSAVLFGKNIEQNSNGYKKPSRTRLESRVLQHELGHLLGLVNVGTHPLDDHHDSHNGKHCTNKNCLMYYLTDTEENPGYLYRKGIATLDKDCIADLRANGGRK